MTSDNFITKVQRALALIADIGSSIASVEKKLEEFFKSRLASVTPRITARSGFIKLHLDQNNADGTTDTESAYVNLPAATEALAGLMTAAQYKSISSLPPVIVTDPYFEKTADSVTLKSTTRKLVDGSYQFATAAHGALPVASTTQAGLMSRADASKLALLDKVQTELTGVADERSLEIYAGWDPEITSMHDMFNRDSTLVYFPKVDTSKVTDFSNAFDNATNLKKMPKSLDTSRATNMNFMFCGSNLAEMPWMDTSNVTTAMIMFEQCKNITTIPQYDFSKVTNQGWGMFVGCTKLRKVPQLDFSSCSSLINLFLDCSALEEVEPFIAPKMPWSGGHVFHDCLNLRKAPHIDVSLCTNMEQFYWGLYQITEIEEMSTANCTNLRGAFGSCPRLEKIKGSVDVIKATSMPIIVADNPALKYLKLLNLGAQRSVDISDAFRNTSQWGAGSEENRQSLVDSLLTYSYDRAAAGYPALGIQLEPEVLVRLTDEELAAITAKGFTITSY